MIRGRILPFLPSVPPLLGGVGHRLPLPRQRTGDRPAMSWLEMCGPHLFRCCWPQEGTGLARSPADGLSALPGAQPLSLPRFSVHLGRMLSARTCPPNVSGNEVHRSRFCLAHFGLWAAVDWRGAEREGRNAEITFSCVPGSCTFSSNNLLGGGILVLR